MGRGPDRAAMDEPRKLYRNVEKGIVGGVCAGLADYLRSDVTVVRIVVAIASLVTLMGGVLVYAAMWLIVPPAPSSTAAAPPTRPPGPGP